MKNRLISLDLDGVIADTYRFLNEELKKEFGIETNKESFEAFHKGNLPNDAMLFLKEEYLKRLYKNLGNLETVEGAIEGIEDLKNNGINSIVHSYRPNSYKDLRYDIKRITEEWFEKYKIPVNEINLCQTEEEKIKLILESGAFTHVDDSLKIINQIKRSDTIYPILFNQSYEEINNIPVIYSWKELLNMVLEK